MRRPAETRAKTTNRVWVLRRSGEVSRPGSMFYLMNRVAGARNIWADRTILLPHWADSRLRCRGNSRPDGLDRSLGGRWRRRARTTLSDEVDHPCRDERERGSEQHTRDRVREPAPP